MCTSTWCTRNGPAFSALEDVLSAKVRSKSISTSMRTVSGNTSFAGEFLRDDKGPGFLAGFFLTKSCILPRKISFKTQDSYLVWPTKKKVSTLPETNSSHLKNDGWKMNLLLGRPIFRGDVKLQGGNPQERNTAMKIILYYCDIPNNGPIFDCYVRLPNSIALEDVRLDPL